ncbi:diphthamide biosynthesis protein 2 [Capronia coronata CBS 617.96]|uniref:2-(3-amino-3-carboxypropyl)histidine synthase subunit 2 n=1 Tax=Capronia coronata CBS 617.96 TaxID=1182541 RepID=W9YT57_9EURO|nr:diphthamide biosynthesis protein 2 [Capronia coronata CBS 617.96]EXJ96092.1 diphthamide biosynthesis protein 2 [Capronia coronata CBS 617.96]
MVEELTAPPVLSTPDTHVLDEELSAAAHHPVEALSDDQIKTRYEINRTIAEIKQRRWRRVALQFPDQMLPHSARVYQLLARGLRETTASQDDAREGSATLAAGVASLAVEDDKPVRLTILGDTSYGSCCVDEIAAEHVEADAVVHYGRACLSPTARLPVLHIFTTMELDHEAVVKSFRESFPDLDAKVVLTADVPYSAHVESVIKILQQLGYTNVFAASIVHDPSSSIPNRTVPESVTDDPSSLSQWSLFHISEPPTSLLLTLTSRMASVRVYPTDAINTATAASASSALETSTRFLLRRRYATVTSLTTVPVWGILINTLSVKNYMDILSHIQRQVAAAGKKSYLFVVGKLNPAKVANFSEIGGWIVIGCWESSLVDSKEFYKPIITPFELELALQSDDSRLWTGQWRADFQNVLEDAAKRAEQTATDLESRPAGDGLRGMSGAEDHETETHTDSESESEPPEFDLRTGRYVSRSRPMQRNRAVYGTNQQSVPSGSAPQSGTLTRRGKGDMIAVNGVVSPGAEYLAQKRTWRGLGTDFEVRYEEEEQGDVVEEGRTGVARGYTVGDSVRS